jgi:hypothetical protein
VFWGDVDCSISVVSVIVGSVFDPVEARAVMEASSSALGVGNDVDVDRSLFRRPSVEKRLNGSKRRRNPLRGTGGSCEVEGRDCEEPMIDRLRPTREILIRPVLPTSQFTAYSLSARIVSV